MKPGDHRDGPATKRSATIAVMTSDEDRCWEVAGMHDTSPSGYRADAPGPVPALAGTEPGANRGMPGHRPAPGETGCSPTGEHVRGRATQAARPATRVFRHRAGP